MDRDLVIIGSGFGGAVTAGRLGAYVSGVLGGSVLVLERGNDPTGRFDLASAGSPVGAHGNRFRHSLSPEYLGELFDLTTDLEGGTSPTLNVLTGRGLGGGSNVYCGVSLRAPDSVFAGAHAGTRAWPAGIRRATLEPYYARAAEELRVRRLGWSSREAPTWALTAKRDYVFAEGCRRVGLSAAPLKVATFEDANDGWWTSGQRLVGRQSLDRNYLVRAATAGVEMQTGTEVSAIVPTRGGYVVRCVDRRGAIDRELEIEARMVVVAAGAVGSTGLLLRSKDHFRDERRLDQSAGESLLGRRLSANGDYGVMGIVGRDNPLAVEGHKGKPMSSFSPSLWPEHQVLLIPFYAEPLFPALGQISELVPPENPGALGRASTEPRRDRDRWGALYRDQLAQFGDRMLTMGCLALDESEGEVVLESPNAPLQVRWRRTGAQTERRWSVALEHMRRIYESLGGELFADSYRTRGTVNTSHPLGGCPIGDDPTTGIVDGQGEVFGNRGLFVLDGAIVPGALGVNPSLTIAALAERACARLIGGDGTDSVAERLGLG